ncbi:MAG: M48 family metallopeptidase [Steroidobacteraceae bacterium]
MSPASLAPFLHPGYQPADEDERGLWHECEQLEYEIASSNLLLRDPALGAYVGGITNRLLGDRDFGVRTYIVRDPDFNASMFPNGMMLVHTGLLARMRNEAQLAAVLGHECGHFLRQHSLQRHRDLRRKATASALFELAAAGATGSTGDNWFNLASGINTVLILSVFTFSREQESEADAYGLKLMGESAYVPGAAAAVWAQLIEERKASAAARNKRYRDRATSQLSTHPPSAGRMQDLAASADELAAGARAGRAFEDRRAEWLAAVAPVRAELLQEQVKLNDPGASLYLLGSLAADGWDGTLRYFEGEAYRLRGGVDDPARAAAAYGAAVAFVDAPAEAWRAHGYALLKAGRTDDGRRALGRYLELKPDAMDAAMVRFSLAQ